MSTSGSGAIGAARVRGPAVRGLRGLRGCALCGLPPVSTPAAEGAPSGGCGRRTTALCGRRRTGTSARPYAVAEVGRPVELAEVGRPFALAEMGRLELACSCSQRERTRKSSSNLALS